MKKISKFIWFLVFTAIAVPLCDSHASTPSLPFVKISVSIPTESLELADLDARDEFNRPVRFRRQEQLSDLWSKSLNQTILFNLTPMRFKVISLFNSLWDKFTGAIRNTSTAAIQRVQVWFQNKKTKGDKVLDRIVFSRISPEPFQTFREFGNAFFFFLQLVISSTRLLC